MPEASLTSTRLKVTGNLVCYTYLNVIIRNTTVEKTEIGVIQVKIDGVKVKV